MNSGSWSSFRAAAELPDNEPDEGSSHCPDCGLHYHEVQNGCVQLYDEDIDGSRSFPVNAITGCFCRPEDLEHGPPDLDTLPF